MTDITQLLAETKEALSKARLNQALGGIFAIVEQLVEKINGKTTADNGKAILREPAPEAKNEVLTETPEEAPVSDAPVEAPVSEVEEAPAVATGVEAPVKKKAAPKGTRTDDVAATPGSIIV